MADRLEVGIELIHERDAVGNVQSHDVGVGNAVQVLDEGTDGVAMGGDQHALAGQDGRGNGVVPERQHPRNGVLEAFGQGNVFGGQAGIADVAALRARIVGLERGRRHVVAAAPDQHLIISVLAGGLGLVESLQSSVVTLVEAPGALRRQPGTIHGIEAVPEGVDGTLEHARIGLVEFETGLGQQLASLLGLGNARGREIDIHPAGKTVVEVPGGFAMADQNELVHGVRVVDEKTAKEGLFCRLKRGRCRGGPRWAICLF